MRTGRSRAVRRAAARSGRRDSRCRARRGSPRPRASRRAVGHLAPEQVAGAEAVALGHDPADGLAVGATMLDPVRWQHAASLPRSDARARVREPGVPISSTQRTARGDALPRTWGTAHGADFRAAGAAPDVRARAPAPDVVVAVHRGRRDRRDRGTVASIALAAAGADAAAARRIRTPPPSATPTPDADAADARRSAARDHRRSRRVRGELRRRRHRRRARCCRRRARSTPGCRSPSRDGLVFAGWYATPADAAAFAIPGRVNGAEPVVCTDQQVTLHGSWKTPDENAAENARIPILMYHQFTAKPEGEDDWLRGNYAYIGDFDAHLNHIATTGFYLPTWDELAAFIDGRLFLPNHSVIVTDDDADQTWFDLAAPRRRQVQGAHDVVHDHRLPAGPAAERVRAAPLAHPRHAPGRRERRRADRELERARDRRRHGGVRTGCSA